MAFGEIKLKSMGRMYLDRLSRKRVRSGVLETQYGAPRCGSVAGSNV